MIKAQIVMGKIVYWLTLPLIALVVRNSKRTRVVIFCANQVLLVRPLIGRGQWDLPGGGLHRNEDPSEGAAREVYEETGIRLRLDQLLYCRTSLIQNRLYSFEAVVFTVFLDTIPEIRLQRHELAEAKWVNLEAIGTVSLTTGVEHIVKSAQSC